MGKEKSPKDARTIPVRFMMSPRERQMLTDVVEIQGTTISALCRGLVVQHCRAALTNDMALGLRDVLPQMIQMMGSMEGQEDDDNE